MSFATTSHGIAPIANLRRSRGAIVLLACWCSAASLGRSQDSATGVSVQVIADTQVAFQRITAAPRASESGPLLFHALDGTGREGIFYSQGGPPLPVVQVGQWIDDGLESHRVEALGWGPSLNDEGVIALTARLGRGSAVLVRYGPVGEWRFVADSAEAFREFGSTAWIDEEGEVLFRASIDPPGHPDRYDFDPTLFEGEGSALDPDTLLPDLRATPHGQAREHHLGLFLETGVEALTVGGTKYDFADIDEAFALDDRGRVAYRCMDANRTVRMVYADGESAPFTLASTRVSYSDLGPPSVSPRGDVVFAAEHRDTGRWVLCSGRPGRSQPQVLFEDPVREVLPGVSVGRNGAIAMVLRSRNRDRWLQELVLRDPRGQVRILLRSGDKVEGRSVLGFELSAKAFAGRFGIAVELVLENSDGEVSRVVALVKVDA